MLYSTRQFMVKKKMQRIVKYLWGSPVALYIGTMQINRIGKKR